MLAVLLLHANEVVSSDHLIEALWEGEPPQTARKALQVYVSQLRKLFDKERLQTKTPGYLLRVEESELDLGRFQHLHKEGSHAEALSLWRGPPLAEFAYQGFAQPEIARFEELRLACLEDRIEADLASGRHADVIGELDALVEEQPLRQRLRAQLMLALYRSGRDAEALEAYQDGRNVLVEELGIEPRRELRALQQRSSTRTRHSSLPRANAVAVEATDKLRGIFVGREPELEELRGGLDAAVAGRGGLFLLVGEPGIGKSRLADELIRQARARGARVLVGRCWEAGGPPRIGPGCKPSRLRPRVGRRCAIRPPSVRGAAELTQLLPELRDLVQDVPEPLMLNPEGARFRLFDAVSSLLGAASCERPLVLVLEDLHAADEPSLLLLRFVARQLAVVRVLIVGTYRDVDPVMRQPLAATVAELLASR